MDTPNLLNNRYLLEERLGAGGMAVVYRAHDKMLERNVAIKILREGYTNDPDFQERFRQEARAAANLSHPNIVTVHDFGLDGGRVFIVMEYVPGMHLKTILQRRGRLPEEEAVALMIQACAGVGYAHRAGLVHCDIKPHNLLITPDRRLKVTDFGIARALASIQPDEVSDVVWGSPQYFSPEQAAGNAPSPASDVYSLGIILYEMLTGQLPFSAESAGELARLHRDAPPPPPRQFYPGLPTVLEQILFKVLAKEPAARYRTADQLGRVLISTRRATDQPEPLTADIPIPDTLPLPAETRSPALSPRSQPVTVRDTIDTPQFSSPVEFVPSVENPLDIDWLSIGLALLVLISVGGLVPLYIWVIFQFMN